MRVVRLEQGELLVPPGIRLDQQDEIGFLERDEVQERLGPPARHQHIGDEQAKLRRPCAGLRFLGLDGMQGRVGQDAKELEAEREGEREQHDAGCRRSPIERQDSDSTDDGEKSRHLYPRKVPDADPPSVAGQERQRSHEHEPAGGNPHRRPEYCAKHVQPAKPSKVAARGTRAAEVRGPQPPPCEPLTTGLQFRRMFPSNLNSVRCAGSRGWC
jgi:hypothetical protein